MTNRKLSILIPTYNWDISQLLLALFNEISMSNLENITEIIIADDCSTLAGIKVVNAKVIKNLARVTIKYHELKRNIGRSKIRNFLAKEAGGSHLLFLDSDILPDRKDFIRQYINHLSWKIVCGGRSYNQRILLEQIYDFHVYFGKKTEVKSPMERNLNSWRFLFTSNLMIRKDVFESVLFDELFYGHGYEDTEWAIRLSKLHTIYHIDNTASHLGLNTKMKLLNQMRNGTNNYIYLSKLHPMEFMETPIYPLINKLIKLSLPLLRVIDLTLITTFEKLNNNELLYKIYQLDKAVWFAINLKVLQKTTKIVPSA